MMELEIYQCLSRSNIENQILGNTISSPQPRPDLKYSIEYEIVDRDFEINFSDIKGSNPSIGAFQYVEPYIDVYMKQRWPKCIKGKATLNVPNEELQNNEVVKQILIYLRTSCWHLRTHLKVLEEDIDQFSTRKAYRRIYFTKKMLDIEGNRHPFSKEYFIQTEANEHVGPGFVSIVSGASKECIDEFVWSQIIPINNPTNIENDLPRIHASINKIRKHHNSYNELNDARRLLANGEIKAAIRAAASAIDAILRYYCSLWNVAFPNGRLQFDEKIESVLANADMPTYRSVEPIVLTKLLYLYRARNSMHEGECYYKDASGEKIAIKTEDQANEFIIAVEKFTLWIDALV